MYVGIQNEAQLLHPIGENSIALVSRTCAFEKFIHWPQSEALIQLLLEICNSGIIYTMS